VFGKDTWSWSYKTHTVTLPADATNESDQPTNRQTVGVYPASDHNAVAGALQICNISILCRANVWPLLVFVKQTRRFRGTFVAQEPIRRLFRTDDGVAAIAPRNSRHSIFDSVRALKIAWPEISLSDRIEQSAVGLRMLICSDDS
jgi:hypothetical protein